MVLRCSLGLSPPQRHRLQAAASSPLSSRFKPAHITVVNHHYRNLPAFHRGCTARLGCTAAVAPTPRSRGNDAACPIACRHCPPKLAPYLIALEGLTKHINTMPSG